MWYGDSFDLVRLQNESKWQRECERSQTHRVSWPVISFFEPCNSYYLSSLNVLSIIAMGIISINYGAASASLDSSGIEASPTSIGTKVSSVSIIQTNQARAILETLTNLKSGIDGNLNKQFADIFAGGPKEQYAHRYCIRRADRGAREV